MGGGEILDIHRGRIGAEAHQGCGVFLDVFDLDEVQRGIFRAQGDKSLLPPLDLDPQLGSAASLSALGRLALDRGERR
ncbi:hypothetical protein [Glutamicibacter sp. JC586]|uniref:hypothetical protein n=1 Tax=Glutamicibacter sp. JC586 TaxID=2590552 RepID=UPI001356E846|nr:hypothetical protein [Glutamicibacter sp. JC586]